MRIDEANTPDELLTALAAIKPEYRWTALAGRGLTILRATADLCGVDAEDLTKRQAILAIIENF